MTELVFRDDSYTRSCTARVIAADARGIRLDRTVFYPTGGGQPGDTGVLVLASGETGAFGNSPILHNGTTTIQTVVPGAGVQNRGGFTQRTTNAVFYDSPVFAGFQFTGMWQFANQSTNVTSGNTNTKPRAWGAAGTYNAGPLGVALFYEKHQDVGVSSATAATIASNLDDRSYGIAAAYTIGPVKVGAVWKREKYDVTQSAATSGMGEQRVSAWHLGVDWNIAGPHGLRVGYTRSGNVKGTCLSTAAFCGNVGGVAPTASGFAPGVGVRPDAQGSTSASMWQAKYVFAFSKRTELQAGYSRINNSANAGYNYSDINAAGATNVAPGKDPHAWAMTLQHKF